MCGIVGKVSFLDGGRRVSIEEICRMCSRIRHRGPDDEGVYINPKGNVGLGHRRLSIIDLSPAGHEPMCNEDGTVWITFNGEIYNFQTLRSDLEKKRHRFKSNTDVETIIHLWEEYGERCLQYLRGMFAFAIWDEKKQILFLARDRVGKKPLKYYIGKDFVVFASELKAFLDEPQVPREIDLEAIHHFLTLQSVPSPLTGFKYIKKLPPAHYLLINLGKSEPMNAKPTRYWRLDYSKTLTLDEEDWQERILKKLNECVKLRMISDVPLGAFLSGGVDSSAVVALMARHSRMPVKTFSIGSSEERYNELPHARLVSERFNTDHTEFIVEPNASADLETLVWHYEEPFADSSALPTYYVSKLTRAHVTVALNGDGGDENFAGYPWYKAHRIAQWYAKLPLSLKRTAKALFFNTLQTIPSTNLTFQRVAAFLDSSLLSTGQQYHYYWSIFYPYEKFAIYNDKMRTQYATHNSGDFIAALYNDSETCDHLSAALYTDINSYLPGTLLPKVDIASMSVSLEARSPFLDHEFMELCATIPSSLKLKYFQEKYIFKKALAGILPEQILQRKKWGFRIPVEQWFRKELKEMAYDSILNSEFTRQYFSYDHVKNMLDEHVNGRASHGRKIWALLWLSLWHRKFFE